MCVCNLFSSPQLLGALFFVFFHVVSLASNLLFDPQLFLTTYFRAHKKKPCFFHVASLTSNLFFGPQLLGALFFICVPRHALPSSLC
jgi:hypothetical protein